ncbi:MAG: ABC transporter permease, partial [Acidobacteriota bacterium]
MENFFQDIRYSLRMLFKKPSYLAIGVIALSIGIGATTAIFTVVNAVLLRSLPYKDPDRIVTFNRDTSQGGLPGIASFEYLALRQSESFDQVSAHSSDSFNLTGIGEPERISCAQVTASFFPLMGVQPVRGRFFTEGEDRRGAGQVAIISEGFWKRRFGGDEEAIGRALTLNDKPYTIVGIMPASFRFPHSYEIWTPMAADFEAEIKSDMWSLVEILARLKQGASVESAQSSAEAILSR